MCVLGGRDGGRTGDRSASVDTNCDVQRVAKTKTQTPPNIRLYNDSKVKNSKIVNPQSLAFSRSEVTYLSCCG